MKFILMICILIELPRTIFGLQCQRITVNKCQGLGYNMTALPNLANDQNQSEAELKLIQILPLLESNCSKQIRFLLCSSLFPLCSPDVPKPATACKSLCETVQTDCIDEPFMKLWPTYLNCDKLPQPEKQELCMQIPQQQQQQQRNPGDIKTLHDKSNQFWPYLTWKMLNTTTITTSATAGSQTHLQQQPHHHHNHHHHHHHHNHHAKSSLLSKVICPTNFTSLDGDCVPQCNTDAIYTSQQKKITEALILALSAVCFILTLFSLVTFWAEPTRFGYPERPVLFLCLCYNLLSVCYLERLVFHNSLKEGLNDNDDMSNNFGTSSCSLSPPCLASYITTGYLTLCAASWWLIFALCFYLSSNKKWSSEALEKKSGLFHVLAWVPPLGPPIGALLWGAVQPNELTGMCTAPGFVEIPALILLGFGAIFTFRASRSLQSLQDEMRTPATGSQQRFAQIRKRVLVFSLVYFIPTVIAIVLSFFEQFDVHIPQCLTAENCPQPDKSSSIPTFLRLIFHLTGGTLTGMWVWSRKTCESYRSRISASSPTSSYTTNTTNTTTSSNHKTGIMMPKKVTKQMPPLLYSGINFHNVPIYNGHSRVQSAAGV